MNNPSASIQHLAPPYSGLAPVYDSALGIANFAGTRAAFELLVRRYGISFHSASDVGCGTGLFACYLNRRWRVPVFGIDRSPEMLRVAARRCPNSAVCFFAAGYSLVAFASAGRFDYRELRDAEPHTDGTGTADRFQADR